MVNRLQGTIPRLNIVAADTWENVLGKELTKKWYEFEGRDIDQVRNDAYAELEALRAEALPTLSLTQSIQDGSVKNISAGVVNALTSLGSSAIPALATGGAGLFTEMTGDALVDFNEAKAKRLGLSVDELYKTDQAEFGIPATVGALGGSLELIGLKGVSNLISKKITGTAFKKAGIFFAQANKEGLTEFVQTGLEEANRSLGSGDSLTEASKKAVDKMFSKDGLEAYLQGVAGAAGAGGIAQIGRSLSTPTAKTSFADEVAKINMLEMDLAKPEVNDVAKDVIASEISTSVSNIADIIEEDETATNKMSDEQKVAVNNLNEQIGTLETVINDPAVSADTKAAIQGQIDELNKAVEAVKPVDSGINTPTISEVEDGDLYEFRTDDGIIAGVLTSPTTFRIDGISANEVGTGKGSKMFENLISYLKDQGVTTIATESAGEGAISMHDKAVEKGLLTEVSKEGRSATYTINEAVQETKTPEPTENTTEVKETIVEPVSKPVEIDTFEESKKETNEVKQPEVTTEEQDVSKKSTKELEDRWQDLEDKLTDDESRKEFNKVEKELIKRERESIFNIPVEDVPDVINAMSEKRKSGTDTFMEASEGRRVKQIAEDYSNANKENINDDQLIKDFIKGLRGNPDLDYADGLLVRESVKEHVRRGGEVNSLIDEAKKIYTKAGYSEKEAGEVVGMMIKKILKNAETTTVTEQKSLPSKSTTEEVVEEDLPQKRTEEVLAKAEDDLKALKQVTDKTKKYEASMKRITEAKNAKEITTAEFNDLKKRFDDVIGESKPKVKEEAIVEVTPEQVEEAPVVEPVAEEPSIVEEPVEPKETPVEEKPDVVEETPPTDEFDNLINQRLPSGGVRETLSNVERETNEKLSQELKEFEGVDFKESMAYGDKVIQEAKTKFGNEYVGEVLGSIEKSKIPFENKAVLLVSLENDLRSQLKDNPTDARLRKQVDLATKASIEHLRSGATSAAVGVFRQAARANYAVEEAANSIFSNKELKDRAKVEGAVQATSEDIQQEYEDVQNEDVNQLIEEGVSKRIDEIYEALPSARRQRADKAIAALDRIQKKLRSKTYDASIGVPVAIVDAGITTIKAAIKAGVDIADAIELGINKIKEKYGEKWDKEDEFRQDMLNGFKEEKISLKDYQASSAIKQELIDAGYGKSINVKTKNGTEKRDILDWKKLTGIEGSFETMKENINRSMEGKGYTEQQINDIQKELENEYTDIQASIIEKSINELNRRNTPRDNTTKTLARRLAELYNLGLYDQNLDTYTNILNNALGISPASQQAFNDLKALNSDLASLIDTRDANGNKRSDLALSGLETDIKNKMKRVIEKAQFQEGNAFFKVAVGIRNLMSAAQRMMLVKVSQALENPFSGYMNDLHVKLQDAFSKKDWDNKELRAHRKQLGRAMYEDASLRGGSEYGGVGNPFTSKNAIEEYVNGLSKNAMYQAFTGLMSGRLYLDAADSYFKIKRTEKEFTKNLIRVLTDSSNPNGAMSQEDALKYVSEMTTGQSFETSKNEARKIIEGINSRAGKEIIRPVESNVIRVANDLVKDNLVNGQAMTSKQVEQAFKAGYKTAGKSIGHESNNFITDIVQAANRLTQTKLDKALKNKDWPTAAMLNLTDVLLKNILNPFVGGGTNWTVIGLQKMGLPTEYLRSDVGFSKNPIDLTTKQGMKDLDESLSANADRQRMHARMIVGSLTATAAILALRGSGSEDEYKKWLRKHPEAQKLVNKIQPVPLTIYLARDEKNMGLVKAIANSLGSRYNAYTDQDKLLKAVGDFYEGYDKGNEKKVQKAWGTVGNIVGRKAQFPYLSSISNFGDTGTKFYKEFVGKKTPKDKPLKGFFEGYFNNGLMDFLNVSPQDIKEKDK